MNSATPSTTSAVPFALLSSRGRGPDLRTRFLFVLACAAALIGFPAKAEAPPVPPDTVRDYANFCYGEVEIKDTDIPGPFRCAAGTKLTSFREGIALPAGTFFYDKCDAPAWLGSGKPGHQCYDATFIRSITVAGKPDFLGALLCRHKLTSSANETDFDDVAMILHNSKSGKTCWFQTQEGIIAPGPPEVIAKVDGRAVPAPHTAAATAFWLKPSEVAKKKCAQCHDNGPWMNSLWLHSQFDLRDHPANKYETPGDQFASPIWPKTDDFVTVASAGLEGTDAALTPEEQAKQKTLPPCTGCHKLSARITWNAGAPLPYNFNYHGWFDRTVGKNRPPQADTLTAATYEFTHWMPTVSRPGTAAAHDKLYAKHLAELKKCMETPAAARLAPSPCRTRPLALNTAPRGTGAVLAATSIPGGQNFLSVAQPWTDTTTLGPAVPLAPGSSLRLDWSADSTHHYCAIEATFPPGVVVSSSRGPVATGTSWTLADSPPVTGPITITGDYDFDLYCRDEITAGLRFHVSGSQPQPPTLLRLATSVNAINRATASDPISGGGRPATTTNARQGDAVEMSWIAYNVQPDSCLVTEFSPAGPTGRTFPGEVGSIPFAFSSAVDISFSLSCVGADASDHTVSATLHPVIGLTCDVDGDEKITRDDIDAILAARGTAAPGDLRDADKDGQITDLDARICADLADTSVTGSASRVGLVAPPGKDAGAQVGILTKFTFAGPINLGASTVTIRELLDEVGGAGELVKGTGGVDLLPMTLVPSPGGRPNGAIFETRSRAVPKVRVEIQTKGRGLFDFLLRVDRGTIPAFPNLCEGPRSRTNLTTSFVINDGVNPVVISTDQAWRCLDLIEGDPRRPRSLRVP